MRAHDVTTWLRALGPRYELTSNGIQPYIGMSNPTIINYVQKGGRLTKQSTCPQQVHDAMLTCWAAVPAERPAFCFLAATLAAADWVTGAEDEDRSMSAIFQPGGVSQQSGVSAGQIGIGADYAFPGTSRTSMVSYPFVFHACVCTV